MRLVAILTVLFSLCSGGVFAQNNPAQPFSASSDPVMRPKVARPLPQKRVVNRIAATVNGRVITSNEVSLVLRPTLAQLAAQYPRQGPEFHKQLSAAKNKIIDDLIDREMLLGEFEERGLMFPDSVIDQELERTIRMGYGGDRELFLSVLRAEGVTIREFREITKRRLIVSSMRAQKYDTEVPPTPEEVRKEYNKSKSNFRDMSQDRLVFEKIYIQVTPPGTEDGDPEVQFALAELIMQQIKEGKSTFEEMAKSYSRDAHAQDGGVWPEAKRSELAPEFAAILFDAPVNKLIGPLADPTGFTIVRVKKKVMAPAPPLSKIKREIEAEVSRVKSHARYERWIKRLRETAVIKKFM